MNEARRLSWDWYDGVIPENVELGEAAYLETTYSFLLYRSRAKVGLRLGKAAATYLGTMFDLGPGASVCLGDYVLSHGAWFISDTGITVGDYTMISWNVVLMDTYRVPTAPASRRRVLETLADQSVRRPDAGENSRPITIGKNVWIGFNACILPGVTIGDGAIVGAHAVVTSDVPSYTVVAGNPARQVKSLAS